MISLDPIISRGSALTTLSIEDRRRLAFVASQQYVFGVVSPVAGAVARWVVPFLAVASVLGVGCSAAPTRVGPAPAVRLVDDANPLAGKPFYVDPTSPAMAAAHNANPPSPELNAIANTPQAHWVDPGVP